MNRICMRINLWSHLRKTFRMSNWNLRHLIICIKLDVRGKLIVPCVGIQLVVISETYVAQSFTLVLQSNLSMLWHCKGYVGHDVTRHVQSQSRSHLKIPTAFQMSICICGVNLCMEFSFYFASWLQLGSDTELIQIVSLNNLFYNHNGDVIGWAVWE